jgi:hypothetical protein
MRNADQLKRELCAGPAGVFFVHNKISDRQLPVADADSKVRLDARLSQHGKELPWMSLLAGRNW